MTGVFRSISLKTASITLDKAGRSASGTCVFLSGVNNKDRTVKKEAIMPFNTAAVAACRRNAFSRQAVKQNHTAYPCLRNLHYVSNSKMHGNKKIKSFTATEDGALSKVGSSNYSKYLASSGGIPLYYVQSRSYAKGKDKPKTKKHVVVVDDEEMRQVLDINAYRQSMEKLMEQMKDDFTKQLSIRGAAGALETLMVEFDGEEYPLQELAQVGRKNPQLAVLNFSSLPDAIQPVLKAIQESGMNLNPQQEGTTVYISLPKLTREHRENLAKNAKVLFNKYKISFQSVQNKYIKMCKQNTELSEDLRFRVQQQVAKVAEMYINNAEGLLKTKQTELLEGK